MPVMRVLVPSPSLRAHAFTTHFALLAAPAAIDGVRSVAASFRPDVVVREPAELASTIVDRSGGIPVVTIGFGGVVPATARRMADEALTPLLPEAGLTTDSDRLHAGDLSLHPMAASMDQEAPRNPPAGSGHRTCRLQSGRSASSTTWAGAVRRSTQPSAPNSDRQRPGGRSSGRWGSWTSTPS